MTTWDEHGGGRLFVDACATRLGGALSAQLSACLNLLSEEEIWHQPNASSNSVGNIVLHMCGNMRQWIISAVGDRPDVRRRREEFAPESRMPRADLLRHTSRRDAFRRALRLPGPLVGGGNLASTERFLQQRRQHRAAYVRQWIISAVGDRPDIRRRREEFSPESRMPKADLLRLARETLAEAAQRLSGFDPSRLTEEVVVQTRRRTRLWAIFESIEHFSHHLGQVIYATKLTGKDPEFYDLSDEARTKLSGES